MSDISSHVLHDLWPPKGIIFVKFLSQNTLKNLEFVCQCEYASPDNLWHLMGTAWAWRYRHIKLEIRSQKVFMTNFVRLCANFRDFEPIVARTYKLILLQSIIFYQWLIDMTSSMAWHCIHLDMYGKTV